MKGVVGRLLYTGATIRHAYMFMKKRQASQLNQILQQLAKHKDMVDPELLKQKVLQLRQLDS